VTRSTNKRDGTGRWIVPKVEYHFECRGCGKSETRLRHPSGGKARLCAECKQFRLKIRNTNYNRQRGETTGGVVLFLDARRRRHA
jgi:hypothetical protein